MNAHDTTDANKPPHAARGFRVTEQLPSAAAGDLYELEADLTDADRALAGRVRDFVETEVTPCINDHWERAEFPEHVLAPMAKLGIVGTAVSGYGCPGLTRLQTGLVAYELSRGDGSINTLNAVQSGLVIGTIAALGDEEQKQRWLPRLAALDALGAFGLTEPDHGSDAVKLETIARRDGDTYVLNGAKRWIGLGHLADVVIIWARDEHDGHVKAFVVEKDTAGNHPTGYTAEPIKHKIGKRAIDQAHITLDNVRIPAANRLTEAQSFRDASDILASTRTTVAWEALGHAAAAYESAVAYTTHERRSFGRAVASYQLVQNKLATMLADLTAMRLICLRTATLHDRGRLTSEQASLAKMFCADRGRMLCRDARDLLGGNGLLLDRHVARHLTDMEVVHTYEGTDFMQSLILGRAITGIPAFA
jgi:glutaryl-CoA dehydrogenase